MSARLAGEAPGEIDRFWCPRDGTYRVDEDGFLIDPERGSLAAQSLNPQVVGLDELVERRCLVLLGEPGSGKSTTLRQASRLAPNGVQTLSLDLASYGSEDRLVHDIVSNAAIKAWAETSADLCLVVDSLDEALARVPQVGAVLADQLRRLPCQRLLLRIACRTADWQPSLEKKLAELFGVVAVMEILPLRRTDAARIAASSCDAARLLEAVTDSGAGPLAARPLTLNLLARGFSEEGVLPERGAGLYAIGLRSLCEEWNPDRLDSGLRGQLALDERIAIARRVAAATVFSGAPSIWTGREVAAFTDDMTIERLAGGTEPTRAGSIEVTVAALREVLRTGLFTSRGGQRLGWAHTTFADFLAADWIVANNLSPEQANPLFLDTERHCWPQTRLSAAWAVAIAPDRFEFLAREDPAAFQGEVELPSDQLRSAVIEGLFRKASSLASPWGQPYRSLRHRHVAEQIREHLRDPDSDRRRLALELADECAAIELRDDLAAIVNDSTCQIEDRIAACRALSHLEAENRTAAVRALIADDAAYMNDTTDELKGVVLLASWPENVSNAEIFGVLRARRRHNYVGSYAIFISQFCDALTASDVDDGLAWLCSDPDVPLGDYHLAAVANRVLMLAAERRSDIQVVEAFARLVLFRLKHFDSLMYEDFNPEERDPLADDKLRHAVVIGVLKANSTTEVVQGLCNRPMKSQAIVRPDDLPWLAEQYSRSDGDTREALRELFQWTYNPNLPEHRELVLNMAPEHPLHRDLVHSWVDAVELTSPAASEMRRLWGLYDRQRLTDLRRSDDIPERIDRLLREFDCGEARGFWLSARLLTVAPGAEVFGAEYDPDVVRMPRWLTLDEALRERVISAAHRYLSSFKCDAPQWLAKPEIIYHPARAGYQAMMILLRTAEERLRQLPGVAWIEWAPVLGAWSTASANGANWEDKVALFEIAGDAARHEARRALLVRVSAAARTENRPYLSNEAGYLWDATVARTYLSLARVANAEARDEFVATLATHDFSLLRPLLTSWLEDPSDVRRHRLALASLFERDLEASWPLLVRAFDADLALAEQVLGTSLTVRGHQAIPDVPARLISEIYLWTRSKFPPYLDPDLDEAHFVSAREEIARWRDELLRRLRDEGTPESVGVIRDIVLALPGDQWLPRTLEAAKATLRRKSWRPAPIAKLLRLARDRGAVVVNDEHALASAVVRTLAGLQVRLTGTASESHYLWDSHAGRPNSEEDISDYLANELDRALTSSGVVVNREVQIRRNRSTGIGERSDILVDAVVAGNPGLTRLTLPIEVKGAWNREVLTAMRAQLAGRYMRDLAVCDGVYVVVWPDLASWRAEDDGRRQVLAAMSRKDVEAQLTEQSRVLEDGGMRVRIVHLDIDYRRHE